MAGRLRAASTAPALALPFRSLANRFFLLGLVLSALLGVRGVAGELLLGERFDAMPLGPVSLTQAPLTIAQGQSSTYSIEAAPGGGGRSLRSQINSSGSMTTNVYVWLKGTGRYTVEMSFRPTDHNTRLKFGFRRGSDFPTLALLELNGRLTPYTRSGDTNVARTDLAVNVPVASWHRLRVFVDTATGRYDLWLNGAVVASQLVIPGGAAWAVGGIDEFVAQRYIPTTPSAPVVSTMHYDDIALRRGAPGDALPFPEDLGGLNAWFHPVDRQTVTQSPPPFRWPRNVGVDAYEMEIARDPGMTQERRLVAGIPANFLNDAVVLGHGNWYWRVRYTSIPGVSDWSAVRRFRVERDARSFVVPSMETLLANIAPARPRIWATPATLPAYRARATGISSTIYNRVRSDVLSKLTEDPPAEPTVDPRDYPRDDPAWKDAMDALRNASDTAAKRLLESAFVYLIEEDPAVGADAVKRLLALASWDPNGVTHYDVHDQVHRLIAYNSAIAYDWIHGLLDQNQRATVREMIRVRTNDMFVRLFGRTPLNARPFDSHAWTAAGYMGVIAMATKGEYPAGEAEHWFRSIFPFYFNGVPIWGGDDGGFANGTNYWANSTSQAVIEARDAVLSATGFDFFDKAWARNQYLFPLYFFPNGSPTGLFGDDHNIPASGDVATVITGHMLAKTHSNPVAKWLAVNRGPAIPTRELYYYGQPDNTIQPRAPTEYPTARHSRDIGWVAMHSSLVDQNRISLYFRSSPYGSYNHSHADQNAFVVSAFKESLAITAGWYDWYHSPHGRAFAYRTHSANAITHDGRKGQFFDAGNSEGNIRSKGAIRGFATHPSFDATSGDASAAYAANLSRAKRHIIFLKPSTYVVIDDLASNGAARAFEWNLHAVNQMALTNTAAEKSALISKGQARLKAQVHFPSDVSVSQHDKFLSPEGVEFRPQQRFAAKPNQWHAAFTLPPKADTMIVATLDVFSSTSTGRSITRQQIGNCLKLTTAGYTAYIRLAPSGTVNVEDVVFDGAAAVFEGSSSLLIDGTHLARAGQTLISANQPSTIAYGAGRLHVHATADANVSLRMPDVSALRDAKGFDVPPVGDPAYSPRLSAVAWQPAAGMLNLTVEAGSHSLSTPGLGPVAKPVITAHPASTVAFPGASVRFDAAASGSGLSYQWFRGLHPVEGATSPTLILDNVGAADAGEYWLTVTSSRWLGLHQASEVAVNLPASVISSGGQPHENAFGFDPSAGAVRLHAKPAQAAASTTYSVSAFGHADRSADLDFMAQRKTITFDDVLFETHLSGSAYFARLGLQSTSGGAFGSVSANQAIFFDLNRSGNVLRLLYKPAGTTTTTTLAQFPLGSPTGGGGSFRYRFRHLTMTLGGSGWSVQARLESPTSLHAAGTDLEASGLFSDAGVTLAPWNEYHLGLRSVTTQSTEFSRYATLWVGGIEISAEPAVSQPATLTLATHLGTPEITSPPESQTVWHGGLVKFEVSAAGNGLVYQWFHNGAPIPGATGRELVVENAGASHAGEYEVAVSGSRWLALDTEANAETNLPARVINSAGAPTLTSYGYDASLASAVLLAQPAQAEASLTTHRVSAFTSADRSDDIDFSASEKTVSFQRVVFDSHPAGANYFARLGVDSASAGSLASQTGSHAIFFHLDRSGNVLQLRHKSPANVYTTLAAFALGASSETTTTTARYRFDHLDLTLSPTGWSLSAGLISPTALYPGGQRFTASGTFVASGVSVPAWPAYFAGASAVTAQSADPGRYTRLALGGIEVRTAAVFSPPAMLSVEGFAMIRSFRVDLGESPSLAGPNHLASPTAGALTPGVVRDHEGFHHPSLSVSVREAFTSAGPDRFDVAPGSRGALTVAGLSPGSAYVFEARSERSGFLSASRFTLLKADEGSGVVARSEAAGALFGPVIAGDDGVLTLQVEPPGGGGGGRLSHVRLLEMTPLPSDYGAWMHSRGLSGARMGFAADPDGDGRSNLLEFALGSDPASADSQAGPETLLVPMDGQEYLALQVSRNAFATSLAWEAEVSSDLGSWAAGPEHTVVLRDTPTELWVRDARPLSESPRRFMRLRVSRSE